MSQFDLFGVACATSAPAEATDPRDAPSGAIATAGGMAAPKTLPRRRGDVLPAPADAALQTLAAALPTGLHLGTSSWSFPGWRGIVWDDDYAETRLARQGLGAYACHPLLRCVGIDRSFYAPLTLADYQRYAGQVPAHFRFVVKAPSLVCDATVRNDKGQGVSANPCFLDAALATEKFVTPCLLGLGDKAGALVFQFSPLPPEWLGTGHRFAERLGEFLSALPPLPRSPSGAGPCYAVEIRDATLLTPRLIKTLRQAGVRYCLGLHARMPNAARQAAALALLDEQSAGPLVVRWSLNSAHRYEQAKAKYAPFDKLVDPDPDTRRVLATLAAHYARAGQPVYLVVNNKAEGSSPLSCLKLAEAVADTATTS